MAKTKIIMKDILVEKLRQIATLMGDDINVGLRVSKDKCEIVAIGGVEQDKDKIDKDVSRKEIDYIG